MILNYSDEKILSFKHSIFLAGPLPRKDNVENWKEEAIQILKELNYQGGVYIPEKKNKEIKEGDQKEIEWEMTAMKKASKIIFWIPRSFPELLGLTTNVEFGFWLTSGKILYGRPNHSYRNEYLDYLYVKFYHKKPANTLYELLKQVIS